MGTEGAGVKVVHAWEIPTPRLTAIILTIRLQLTPLIYLKHALVVSFTPTSHGHLFVLLALWKDPDHHSSNGNPVQKMSRGGRGGFGGRGGGGFGASYSIAILAHILNVV